MILISTTKIKKFEKFPQITNNTNLNKKNITWKPMD